MLFIDNDQSQLMKGDVVCKQGMGADDHLGVAGSNTAEGFHSCSTRDLSGQPRNLDL